MDKVNKIIQHPLWRESVEQIKECEKKREFCKHDFQHFLDVARLAMIENLEKNLNISKENIYASAMLHDIGRHLQYSKGISHEIASVEIAKIILDECKFEQEQQSQILDAISNHRNNLHQDDLSGLIYRADKMSRNCMLCCAEEKCNWDETKKNMYLRY